MIDDLLSGTAGSVVVSGVLVGEVSEWALDLSQSPVETTAFGVEWALAIHGLQGASGSFSGNFDSSDSGQNALQAAMDAGTSLIVDLYMGPTQHMEMWALLTGSEDGVAVDGQDTSLWNFVATGNVVYAQRRKWLLEDGAVLLWEDDTQAWLTL